MTVSHAGSSSVSTGPPPETPALLKAQSRRATVNRRVTALEHAFGAKLFDRSPAGYGLTLQGERLLPFAESVETAAISSFSELGNADLSAVGSIRIGAPEGFGTFFLAPRLDELAQANPELDIELAATPRVSSLSKREADIAIRLNRPVEGRLRARKLVDYDLAIYASRTYLERNKPIQERAHLKDHRIIAFIDDMISPQLNFGTTVFEGFRISIKSSNLIPQLTATLAGVGLCVLPCFIADAYDLLVPVLDKDVRVPQTYWLITHADTHGLARNKVAADFIVQQVQRAQSGFWRPHAGDPDRQQRLIHRSTITV
jgi:DNA-binding transcriptional LysR family regulator